MDSKRGFVLDMAVELEGMISIFLSQVLNINLAGSKIIGTAPGALSFQNKIQLLKERKNLIDKEPVKLQIYSEIRNKFAHLAEVRDFESCFIKFNDEGNYKNLKQFYNAENKNYENKEEELKSYFVALHKELIDIVAHRFTQAFFDNSFAPKRKEILDAFDAIYLKYRDGDEEATKFVQYFGRINDEILEMQSQVSKLLL